MKLPRQILQAYKDGKLMHVNTQQEAIEFLNNFSLYATHPLSIYKKLYKTYNDNDPDIKGLTVRESINKMIDLISAIHPVK